MFFMDTSSALGQSYGAHSSNEETLMNIGKIGRYLTETKHNKTRYIIIEV